MYIDNWKFNLCCDGHMTRSYTLMKLQHLTKSTDAHLTQEMFSYFMTMSVIEFNWFLWCRLVLDHHSITGYGFSRFQIVCLWKMKKKKVNYCTIHTQGRMHSCCNPSSQKVLIQLLRVWQILVCSTVTVHCNNEDVLALAKNSAQHQRSKFINIKFHFISSI